jgi:hypothetical protein
MQLSDEQIAIRPIARNMILSMEWPLWAGAPGAKPTNLTSA